MKKILTTFFISIILMVHGCVDKGEESRVVTVVGEETPVEDALWLSHEHLLVDFIGADSIDPAKWDHDSVIGAMSGLLEELKEHHVRYFVDATPAYLGRDALLLEKLSKKTGIRILTNTGFYGAVGNKYLPSFAFDLSPEQLAHNWSLEFENGIDGSSVKPGFIKISVDAAEKLHPVHEQLVKAAGLTHLRTGLTILSHTGEAKGLWPQLDILRELGVAPSAFVWVHAQNEPDNNNYVRAGKEGCWISLDGLGWEMEKHLEKLVFAKEQGILDHVLISHDAGWYDPQKEVQNLKPYTDIFKKLLPALRSRGFNEEEIGQLLSKNPAKAFAVRVRKR